MADSGGAGGAGPPRIVPRIAPRCQTHVYFANLPTDSYMDSDSYGIDPECRINLPVMATAGRAGEDPSVQAKR